MGRVEEEKDYSFINKIYTKPMVKFFIAPLAIAFLGGLFTHLLESRSIKQAVVQNMSERFEIIKENMSYELALDELTKYVSNIENDNKELKSQIEDLNNTIKEKDAYIAEQSSDEAIADTIRQATDYWNNEDYVQALILLKKNGGASEDIHTLYKQYSNEYAQLIIGKANELVNARKYSEAEDLLNEALNQDILADSSMIKEQLAKIKTNHPVELASLKMTDDRHIELAEKTVEDTVGNKYPSGNVFIIHAEGEEGYGSGLFYTGNKYQYLSGVIAVSDESTKSDSIMLEGHIEILTKNKEGKVKQVYESETLSRAISQIPLDDIDIENSEWLEIRFYSSDDYFSLAEGYHSLSIILSDFELYN